MYLLYWTIVLSGLNSGFCSGLVLSEYWRKDRSSSYIDTTGELIFTEKARNPSDCASVCAPVTGCYVFGYSITTSTCHGYSYLESFTSSGIITVLEETEVIYKNLQNCARAGYTVLGDGELCLRLHTETYDWFEAQSQCEGDHGRLAVIDTQRKYELLVAYIDNVRSERIWMGVTDEDSEGTWVWNNGDHLDRSYWNEVQLNDYCTAYFLNPFSANCGVINYGNLFDDHCAMSHPFLCERVDII